MTRLILASGSAIRAQLLRQAGVRFEIVPARIDEEQVKESLRAERAPVERTAQTLAEMKALRVSASHPDAHVLGADQILSFGDRLVSKSTTVDEARALLGVLRGECHKLIGATVLAKDGVVQWRHTETMRLWMRNFSDVFLENYLETEGREALSSVGCYRLEGLGAQLFSRVEGDYFSILGLPLLPVLAALREHGIVPS